MKTPEWTRPPPTRTLPRRGAGGFYRTADVAGAAQGVPLASTSDALAAAVRLAYRVAEAQVDRSSRLAASLRDAGDRVTGGDSARKSMDATERLVMNTMMSALEWWETSVAQGRCPVKRLAAAEYRMLGQVLGFDAPRGSEGGAPADESAAAAASRPARRAKGNLRIVLHGQRRPARLIDWQLGAGAIDGKLEFFHESGATLAAKLELGRGAATLTLEFPKSKADPVPRGRWSAAICSAEDEQLGFMDIEL